MNLRIHNKHQAKYYYALSRKEALRVKLIGCIGILSLLVLLIGFYFFASQSALIAIICTPLFVIISLYHFINFWLMLYYPGFDTKAHRVRIADFKKANNFPRVAVFIAAAGEDLGIVRQTLHGAMKIRYPNYEVFLLDDSRLGVYKELSANLGATYVRRKNVGQHKKAGNMNSALKGLKGFSHVLVLDADFVPKREILTELTPYAKDDVGIVQSPQHFELTDAVYERSKIEFGAGMIQRDFYRITQVARNRFGGAICVGTNALYSIKALDQVGGFEGVGKADWGHSEDVNTGLKMINSYNSKGDRYRIEYVPIQLAKGICPSDHLSFYKQQNRWATGSMQLIFSKKTLFSKALSTPQRITYFSNSVYYFYTMGLLFAPLQLLILLLSPTAYDWRYTLLFLPMLFVTYILTPYLLRQKIEPVASAVVVISNAYTFMQALGLLVMRRPLGWEATGARNQSRKRHMQFRVLKLFSSFSFISVYLATLAVLVMNYNVGFNPSTFIILVFLGSFIGHIIFLHHMLAGDIDISQAYRSRHAYGYATLALILGTTLLTSYAYSSRYDVKYDSGAIVAFVEQKPAIATEPANVQQSPMIAATPEIVPAKDIAVTVDAGDCQSSIASRVVNVIRIQRGLSIASAGKLQDKLMHQIGYKDLVYTSDQYIFTENQIDALIRADAFVQEHEKAFWAEYAARVQIKA